MTDDEYFRGKIELAIAANPYAYNTDEFRAWHKGILRGIDLISDLIEEAKIMGHAKSLSRDSAYWQGN